MLARLVERAATVLAVIGAMMAVLVAPALAGSGAPTQDPPREPRQTCAAPEGGAVVCFKWEPDPTSEYWFISAWLTAEPGRTIKAGLVAMEGCSGDCTVQKVATGWNVTNVWTEKIYYGRGTGYYRANATWVDDQNVWHNVLVS